MTIAVIAGMKAEARLLPAGVPCSCSGGSVRRAYEETQRLLEAGAAGVVSFGIAGALAPDLRPGTLLVGDTVIAGGSPIACTPSWRRSLTSALPQARSAVILGGAAPIATPGHKRLLRERWQAAAVDLESMGVAQACSETGSPFAVLRAIADPAERALPEGALAGLAPDGGMRPLVVAAGLLRRPGDLPAMVGLALEARAALRALAGAARRLGPSLGFEPVQAFPHH